MTLVAGLIPMLSLVSLTLSSSVPRSAPSCLSEKPSFFASDRVSASRDEPGGSRSSDAWKSVMFFSFSTYHLSTSLLALASSTARPALRASARSKSMVSVGRSRRAAAAGRPSTEPPLTTPSYLGFDILTAFWMASSKPRPTAITSPMDFIEVSILLTPPSNLSVSQRGIFTTR